MKTDIKWRKPLDWWRINWKKNQERIVLFEQNDAFHIESMTCFYYANGLPCVFMAPENPLSAELVEVEPEKWKRFAIVT